MRLLTKLNLYYFLMLSLAFLIGGSVAYKVLEKAVKRGVHRVMKAEEDYIRERLAEGVELAILNSDQRQLVRSIALPLNKPLDQFEIYDTTIFQSNCSCLLPYRALNVNRQVGQRLYNIQLVRPMVQSQDLIRRTSVLLARVALVVLVILLLFNFFFSRSLLKPFYHTLDKVKKHRLTEGEILKLEPSTTYEFETLNQILRQMTDRIQKDYLNLKAYTENTAHEIQTPLTIIKSKLELLANADHFTAEQSQQLESAYMATQRLSKLSQTLGLLTKIENHQFQKLEKIDIRKVLEKRLLDFEELIQLKGLNLDVKTEAVEKKANPFLLDLMLTNLIKNGIIHNVEQGYFKIQLNANRLVLTNSGEVLPFPALKIFDRFATGKPGTSLGLGLAIVSEICQRMDWKITYDYADAQHQFHIAFDPS